MSCLKYLFHLVILFTACNRASAEGGGKPEGQCLNGFRAMAYYTNWSGAERTFCPTDMPLDNLTHVLYAFANINPESGEVYLSDEWADTQKGVDAAACRNNWLGGALGEFQKQKTKLRSLKVLLSIGGWKYSSSFAAPASSPSGRAKFASSAVRLVKTLGFDGVDIDWEYPDDDEQAENFVRLLQEVREAFDRYSDSINPRYHFEITVACPAGPSNYQRLKLPEMDPFIDSWNIMAYDYSGPWSNVTAHQANIFSANDSTTPFDTDTAVRFYISKGIAPSKIVIGMPLYGRIFRDTLGLGQSFERVDGGAFVDEALSVFDLPLPGTTEVDQLEVGGSYCWDSNKKSLISYDSLKVATLKAEWIRRRNLGGAMWWESSGDRLGENSTIRHCVMALSCLQRTENMLNYPDSGYINVRRNASQGIPSQHEPAVSSADCVNSTYLASLTTLSSAGGESKSDTSKSETASMASSSLLPATSSSVSQSSSTTSLCDPDISAPTETKNSSESPISSSLLSMPASECLLGLNCPGSWTVEAPSEPTTVPPIVIFSTTTLPPSVIVVTSTIVITLA